MIKRLDSSKIRQFEKPKPDGKNFRPVPDKYYPEDEGLAKAAGGGLRAFEEQQRRNEELQREREDERLARMIQTQGSISESKTGERPTSEIDPDTLILIQQLQTEESKFDKPADESKSSPRRVNLREEIIKTVVELKGVSPQLNDKDFLQFAKDSVSLAWYSKFFPTDRVLEITEEVTFDLFPPLQVPKRYGFCCV